MFACVLSRVYIHRDGVKEYYPERRSEILENSLVRVRYVSLSFISLRWLSKLDGLLGFKGFIGKALENYYT